MIQSDDTIFSSSIIIEESERWQLVGASQSYNTNYGIYAKFTCNKKSKHVKEIKLQIINYRGMIRMGIFNAYATTGTKKGDINIYVQVQGLNSKEDHVIEDLNLHYKKNSFIRSERILMPMHILSKTPSPSERDKYFKREIKEPFVSDCEQDKVCYFFSYVKDLEDFNIPVEEYNLLPGNVKELIKNQAKRIRMIFDTEYFYVDGNKHIIPKYDYDEDPKNRASDIIDKLPGLRCKMGSFKVE